ncbi:MAG: hypothetical protein R3E77_11240 [Steroidobacteraceae bacterium]
MKPKSAQLQIRVTAAEKAAIQRLAKDAGLDMSAYVLERVLSSPAAQFANHVGACRQDDSARFALAELNSFLSGLSALELMDAVAVLPAGKMSSFVANYVAALVESACQRKNVPLPQWLGSIEPLAEPFFASGLQSLRLYLLTQSPAPFRGRNIFVDSSLGDRV